METPESLTADFCHRARRDFSGRPFAIPGKALIAQAVPQGQSLGTQNVLGNIRGSRGKPCLGYRSRTAAVAALDQDGFSNAEIASLISEDAGETITASLVGALLSSYRRTQKGKLGQLPVYGAYLKSAAGVNRKQVVTFLRELAAEIEGAAA